LPTDKLKRDIERVEKRYTRSLFIFRRDLRVEDNTALNAALLQSEEVIPCFIFDPRQAKPHDYFSPFAFRFLLESLKELKDKLEGIGGSLNIFEGMPDGVIQFLAKTKSIDAVFFNRDYTPFSRKRDKLLHDLCENLSIKVHQFADALLNEPELTRKSDNNPYTVFTPYFKRCSLLPVKVPVPLTQGRYALEPVSGHKPSLIDDLLKLYPKKSTLNGGERSASKILNKLKSFQAYQEERDFPQKNKTTHLSPHLKFGTVSVREVHASISQSLGGSHPLLRQLYWRDFFTHITFNFPEVLGKAFQKKYENIEWHNNEEAFSAWREGKTGFPIVDAGMRELLNTGYMHNRVRMIVSSFLTKDLHIDWRWGEKHFAQNLIDYDPAVNNGNWQWAASTGCDAQPYFRIFNPWLQQKKFDANCEYIKHWIPELSKLTAKQIHGFAENKRPEKLNYPEPMVDHAIESSISREMFEGI